MSDERYHEFGGSEEWMQALRGARLALESQLVWEEEQYESTGSWRVGVRLPGFHFYGNDGHLLSQDREEGRDYAFFMLLTLIGEYGQDESAKFSPAEVDSNG